MGAERAHLAQAAELERRDEDVAREIALVTELGERAEEVRAQAAETRLELERIPHELEDIAHRRTAAESEVRAARDALHEAGQRLEHLESARRRRDEELERARRELETAEEVAEDAERQVERLKRSAAELRAQQASLVAAAEVIADAAGGVSGEIAALTRVAEAGRRKPGTTLEAVEEWGSQVRSALFVARGTLESERERIVVEANALGSAVLGEQLGASSVALVRRRIQEALG